jgi:hypothetical protein
MNRHAHQHDPRADGPAEHAQLALDDLVNQALDAHGAGDAQAAARLWQRIEREHADAAHGALALRDALHALAASRPTNHAASASNARDITDAVLARLDADRAGTGVGAGVAAQAAPSDPVDDVAPTWAHAAAAHTHGALAVRRGAPSRGWLSRLRVSPVAAAFVLGAGVTAALMIVSRAPQRGAPVADSGDRAAPSVALDGLPGVEESLDAEPLRLGNADKYRREFAAFSPDHDLRAGLAHRAVPRRIGVSDHTWSAHASGLVALPPPHALIVDAPPRATLGFLARGWKDGDTAVRGASPIEPDRAARPAPAPRQ